jgi:uncharacterized protein
MSAHDNGTADLLRVRLPITGMTCAACERRVTTALSAVRGVESATVSARSGNATLTVAGEIPWGELAVAVEQAGYAVGRSPWFTRDSRTWRRALIAVLLVGVAAWLLSSSAWGTSAPGSAIPAPAASRSSSSSA